jgi:hypothetical protein
MPASTRYRMRGPYRRPGINGADKREKRADESSPVVDQLADGNGFQRALDSHKPIGRPIFIMADRSRHDRSLGYAAYRPDGRLRLVHRHSQ